MQPANKSLNLPAGLARVRQDIERLAQESIRITARTADEAALAVGSSRLGGRPDLPPGADWPAWKGVPMAFIAQVRLPDVRAYDAAHALPRSGMLWFFYDAQQQTYGADPDDRGGWQVRYAAGTRTRLQRAEWPANLPAAAQFRPCALTFARELTLPQRPEIFLPQLDWTADERKQYEDFLATYPSPDDRATVHHRILGHSDDLQDDMHLQCALASQGIRSVDDPRAEAAGRSALNWRLLLQIDSDEQAGMEWGNDGRIYYWIEQSALQARNFENVWLALQSE